jgi:glutamine synthetase
MKKDKRLYAQESPIHKRSVGYSDDIKEKYFEDICDAVDKLELLVDNVDWPLVKYRELLFLR